MNTDPWLPWEHSGVPACLGFGWEVWELPIWTWITTFSYYVLLCADTHFEF